MDALLVASALRVKADEFITTEKPTKAIHRCKALTVISIHP